MSVDYVAAARATDVVARARVVRRGRSLCFVTVEAVDNGGRVVATGQVCHRYA
jgi:acyl-coenzyme A thioesterase PaaI-like protein